MPCGETDARKTAGGECRGDRGRRLYEEGQAEAVSEQQGSSESPAGHQPAASGRDSSSSASAQTTADSARRGEETMLGPGKQRASGRRPLLRSRTREQRGSSRTTAAVSCGARRPLRGMSPRLLRRIAIRAGRKHSSGSICSSSRLEDMQRVRSCGTAAGATAAQQQGNPPVSPSSGGSAEYARLSRSALPPADGTSSVPLRSASRLGKEKQSLRPSGALITEPIVAERESSRQAVEPVQVGKVLIARLHDAVEQFETEAAFLIREVKDCKTGLLLGVNFVARRSKGGSTADADAEAQAAEIHARERCPAPPPAAPPPKTALERLWSKAQGAEPDKEQTPTLASGITSAELKERLAEERKKSAEAEARAAAAKDRRSRSKVSAHGEDKERDKSRRGSSELLDTLTVNKEKKGGRRNKTGSTSDRESAHSEETPKHRRKHSKKDRRGRRRSSSSSSSVSLSADELFHGAGGGNGLASKLVKVARRHPGKLLGKTLEAMNTTLSPGAGPLGEEKPTIMFQYLQKASAARRSDPRTERELTTVALAVDNILQGNREEALDILAQRFKRAEAGDSSALHRDLAERLEVIPDARITSLSLDEQEKVANMDR